MKDSVGSRGRGKMGPTESNSGSIKISLTLFSLEYFRDTISLEIMVPPCDITARHYIPETDPNPPPPKRLQLPQQVPKVGLGGGGGARGAVTLSAKTRGGHQFIQESLTPSPFQPGGCLCHFLLVQLAGVKHGHLRWGSS